MPPAGFFMRLADFPSRAGREGADGYSHDSTSCRPGLGMATAGSFMRPSALGLFSSELSRLRCRRFRRCGGPAGVRGLLPCRPSLSPPARQGRDPPVTDFRLPPPAARSMVLYPSRYSPLKRYPMTEAEKDPTPPDGSNQPTGWERRCKRRRRSRSRALVQFVARPDLRCFRVVVCDASPQGLSFLLVLCPPLCSFVTPWPITFFQ